MAIINTAFPFGLNTSHGGGEGGIAIQLGTVINALELHVDIAILMTPLGTANPNSSNLILSLQNYIDYSNICDHQIQNIDQAIASNQLPRHHNAISSPIDGSNSQFHTRKGFQPFEKGLSLLRADK